jgi:hypothetical protein
MRGRGCGRGRGRGWRRGRSRRAVRMLEPTLLLLLHHTPAHGYTLLERLGEFGLADLNTSVVYRALRDMETKGWVTSTWDEEQTQGPPPTGLSPHRPGGRGAGLVDAGFAGDASHDRSSLGCLQPTYGGGRR